MEFNELIENPDKLRDRIKFLFDFNSGYEGSKDYFRYVSHELIQPSHSYVECLATGEPYKYTIKVLLEIYEGPHKGDTLYTELYIPKLCKNGFLIQTSSGQLRWRSPINICLVRKLIRYYNKTGQMKIQLNTDKYKDLLIYDGSVSGSPGIAISDNEGKIGDSYNLLDYLLKSGVDEKSAKSVISGDLSLYGPWVGNTAISIENSKNKDGLNNKILQLLKKDLPDPDYITGDIIYQLLLKIKQDNKSFEPYSPMDCEFKSQLDMLMEELRLKAFKLYRLNADEYGRYGTVSSRGINRAINAYFSMQSEMYNAIQTTSDSNASSFLSQTNKIYFATLDKEVSPFVNKAIIGHVPVQYTDDFIGTICPVKTPEAVSGINIKNELARSAILKEGKLYIKVLDKYQNEVELPIVEYYKARILATTNWDYENQEIKPNNDGTITVLQLGEQHRVQNSGLNFDYLSLDGSSILSYNASMIPGANHSDSVRLSMACSEMDQAIPVVGSRPPVIYTGVESEVYKVTDLNFKADDDSEVTEVTNDYIKVKLEDGSDKVIQIPESRETLNHTYSRYNVNVKPGMKIKKGDVIISSDSFKDKELALVTQLRSAFMHFKFKEEEDGFVLSESATKKLAHVLDAKREYSIPTGISFEFNYDRTLELSQRYDKFKKDSRLNEFGLPIVGSKFYHNENLALFIIGKVSEKRKIFLEITGGEEISVARIPTPPTVDECVVTDVIVKHKLNLELTDNNAKCIEYYDSEFNKRTKPLTDSGIIIGSNIIDPKGDNSVEIVIKLRSVNIVKLGDKLANRFGGKGTVIAIYPDNHMPRIGGPNGEIIECISSPLAPFNRKNPSQLIEHDLTAISNKLWNKHIDLINNGNFDEIRSDLNELFVTTKFNGYSDEDLVKLHDSYEGFYRIKVSAMDTRYTPKVLLHLTSKFEVDEGVYVYLPGKINDLEDEYFMKTTKRKIQVGYSEYMRLHFLPEKKARATSDYKGEESEELVLGNGGIRAGGQSQGNMEIWAYMSHGTLDAVDKVTSKSIYDDAIKEVSLQMSMLGLQLSVAKAQNGEINE